LGSPFLEDVHAVSSFLCPVLTLMSPLLWNRRSIQMLCESRKRLTIALSSGFFLESNSFLSPFKRQTSDNQLFGSQYARQTHMIAPAALGSNRDTLNSPASIRMPLRTTLKATTASWKEKYRGHRFSSRSRPQNHSPRERCFLDLEGGIEFSSRNHS